MSLGDDILEYLKGRTENDDMRTMSMLVGYLKRDIVPITQALDELIELGYVVASTTHPPFFTAVDREAQSPRNSAKHIQNVQLRRNAIREIVKSHGDWISMREIKHILKANKYAFTKGQIRGDIRLLTETRVLEHNGGNRGARRYRFITDIAAINHDPHVGPQVETNPNKKHWIIYHGGRRSNGMNIGGISVIPVDKFDTAVENGIIKPGDKCFKVTIDQFFIAKTPTGVQLEKCSLATIVELDENK